MVSIPAASLNGVNLARIREQFPEKAVEIERIGKLLLTGMESEDEFLRLCRLLFEVGEKTKSAELLRANASEGDAAYTLYKELHGPKAEEAFRRSIAPLSGNFSR